MENKKHEKYCHFWASRLHWLSCPFGKRAEAKNRAGSRRLAAETVTTDWPNSREVPMGLESARLPEKFARQGRPAGLQLELAASLG